MRIVVLALVALIALPGLVPALAVADDKAHLVAARKLLDTALTGGLEDAGSRPAAKGAVTIFPGKLDSGGDWMGWRMGPPYIGTIKIVASAAGWSGTWGWIAADLAVTQRPYSDSSGAQRPARTHRYHVLEVYVLESGAVKVKATMLVDTIDDAKQPLVAAGNSPKPGPVAGSLAAQLIMPGVAKLVAGEVAVMGSSQTDLGLGQVAAKKLLASWKKLELWQIGTAKELASGDLGIAFGEVELVSPKGRRRYRAMVVARQQGKTWEVAALSFGADSAFGDPKVSPP